jgi:hypothetical protein
MCDYQYKQYLRAKENHDEQFNLSIKIFGTSNHSNQLNITKKQEKQIMNILKKGCCQ